MASASAQAATTSSAASQAGRQLARLPAALPPLLWAVALALALRPAIAHAIDVWSTTEEFSYGFLIIPLAGLLVFRQRNELRLRASSSRGANVGLALVIGALLVLVFAQRAGIHALAGLAVSPLIWGGVVFLWGWQCGRLLAFPIGFLAFGLAVFRGLLDTLGFAMQGVTAFAAATGVRAIGLPVTRDGLVLQSDRFVFVVAEPCSGMSSLLALLALASLWLHLTRGPLPARVVVLASVLPIVLLANSARVAAVLVVAWWFGQDAALGFFHAASSLVLFGLSLMGLLIVSRGVGCRLSPFAA